MDGVLGAIQILYHAIFGNFGPPAPVSHLLPHIGANPPSICDITLGDIIVGVEIEIRLLKTDFLIMDGVKYIRILR